MVDLRPVRGPLLTLGEVADSLRELAGVRPPPLRLAARLAVQSFETRVVQTLTLSRADRESFGSEPSTGFAFKTPVCRYGNSPAHATNGRFITESCGMAPVEARQRLALPRDRTAACMAEGELISDALVHVGPIADGRSGSTGSEQVVLAREGDVRWHKVRCR